ncbi:MAG: hypothetical protein QXW79_01300 [Thermoplasmata archaeon]
MNNLNNFMKQHPHILTNTEQNTSQETFQYIRKSDGPKNYNIIEELLKPQKIVKNNKDIEANYKLIKDEYKLDDRGHLVKKFKITNAPYKNIIKDKIVTKKVEEVREEDLVVYKVNKKIDANPEKFNEDLKIKKNEKEKINEELKMEFHPENYSKHKKNFEYKETFIRNMTYNQNTFNEIKQDYIEFYRKKQREMEEGQKLCDQILHTIDDNLINKNELPTAESMLQDLGIQENVKNVAGNNK